MMMNNDNVARIVELHNSQPNGNNNTIIRKAW